MPRLTKAQAAAKLGELFNAEGKPFSDRTISYWMTRYGLPHFRVGRLPRFDADAIVRWAERRFTRNPEPVHR